MTAVTKAKPGSAYVKALPGFTYCPSWARTRTLLIQNVAAGSADMTVEQPWGRWSKLCVVSSNEAAHGSAQSRTDSPCFFTTASILSASPLGRLAPISHFSTVLALVLSRRAKTA